MSSQALEADLLASDSESCGAYLAPLDVLADVDISGLQVYLDGDAAGSDAVAAYERVTVPSLTENEHGSFDNSASQADEREHASSSGKRRLTGQRKERRRLQLIASARRHRNRKKNELLDLQEEAVFLEGQLELLRLQRKTQLPSASLAQWEERAAVERHQRRRVEAVNEQLRNAIYLNGHYLRGLRSVFSSSPMVNAELDLQQLLHSYSHLGLSAASRLRECRSLCTNTKLDRAMQVLIRETDGISLESPSITTRQVRVHDDQFGMTCVGVYALDTVDVDRIFQAASGSILGFGSEWPNHTLTKSSVQLADSPAASIRYGIFSTRYRNDTTADEVVLGGRMFSYYRVTGSYIVLLWDFVDQDDVYPLPSDATIRRDVTGALLVRQETCPDGVERVVCRSACTKLHTFQRPTASNLKGAKLFGELMAVGAKVCGTEVYNAIRQDKATHYAGQAARYGSVSV